MDLRIDSKWKDILSEEFAKEYFSQLNERLDQLYKKGSVAPMPELVFNAFNHCSFSQVKVVIIGQDPYHGLGQAHGLSFSVPEDIPIPPSLKNIYKEIASDIGISIPDNGNLEKWAGQGVLLLNATLTVSIGQAGSHHKIGWEIFTDAVIQKISEEKEHIVFLLWGNYAKAKGKNIDRQKHLVLEAAHPSPLSAYNGFFGCQHFSKTNNYLKEHNQKPIIW